MDLAHTQWNGAGWVDYPQKNPKLKCAPTCEGCLAALKLRGRLSSTPTPPIVKEPEEEPEQKPEQEQEQEQEPEALP
jgi:hypothetical protein